MCVLIWQSEPLKELHQSEGIYRKVEIVKGGDAVKGSQTGKYYLCFKEKKRDVGDLKE